MAEIVAVCALSHAPGLTGLARPGAAGGAGEP